jgi:hypothetical protein
LQGIPCQLQGPAVYCNASQLGARCVRALRGRLGHDAAPDPDWTPFGSGSIRLTTRGCLQCLHKCYLLKDEYHSVVVSRKSSSRFTILVLQLTVAVSSRSKPAEPSFKHFQPGLSIFFSKDRPLAGHSPEFFIQHDSWVLYGRNKKGGELASA